MEEKIKVPSELSEISLLQYQMWVKARSEFGEELTDQEYEFLKRRCISIFCDIKVSSIMLMTKHSVDDVYLHVMGVLQSKQPFEQRFTIKTNEKEIEFGMIPELDKMSYGEYVDIKENMGEWESMDKAMAVLFRPISAKHKDKYDITPYEPSEALIDLMKYMPLSVVFGVQVFFWTLIKELVSCTQKSLIQQGLEELLTLQPNLRQNGDGIQEPFNLQTEISE